MIISCGKFSSSFTAVGSSFSGGTSIWISSVFTTTSSVTVKRRQFLMHVWMTKISGNQQQLKPFLNNRCLGGIKQGAFVITFCSENLPLLMIITGGKFSSSFTVGSSCSGGDSIFISSVFTNTSSIKKRRKIFIAHVDDQRQRQQAKIKIF